MANITFQDAYLAALAANTTYSRNQQRWQFLLDSHNGGQDYRNGAYLQRYQLESDRDYNMRLQNTPLDNQCKSLISLYTSFLFRTEPDREFGTLDQNPTILEILEDADLDGRSMNAFMKDVATLSSIFGHVWIAVAKPDVGAVTLADEIALGARPYLSLYTPLAVTDWHWQRSATGGYDLDYIKYVEEVNGSETVIKEWTLDTITTYTLNTGQQKIQDLVVVPNGLGRVPFICAYAERSQVRGLGLSMIDDISDMQKMIYNELSEVYDSIRLDTHPSLVATAGTNVQGASAGQVITMEESIDPALKPYVLNFAGGQIDKIYLSIENRRRMIDSMGNVGSVRATETSSMSGVAIETEFQLLNARLSAIGDNMELAEEQIWQLCAEYLGTVWTGRIRYADNFALRNVDNELAQLTAAMAVVTDPARRAAIEQAIMDVIAVDTEDTELVLAEQHARTTPADRAEHIQTMIMEGYEDDEILDIHPEITSADILAAKQALLNSNG